MRHKGDDKSVKKAREGDATHLRRRAEEIARVKVDRMSDEFNTLPPEEIRRLLYELQVHQIELEMQNEELMQSRAAVEKGLAIYTDLYDFAPVSYFSLDRGGMIRQANLTGARLLRQERSRLINVRFGNFVSKGDGPVFNAFLEKVFASRAKETCEVAIHKEEKVPLLSELSGSRYFDQMGQLIVHIEASASADSRVCHAVVTDITARKQAEAALRESHVGLERNLKGSIDVISETIERKGPYVPGHHRRVASLASAIAQEMGMTDFQVQGIGLAAAVYDIGLMDIPIEYLQDTGKLEGTKRALYQSYPQSGHDSLKKIEFLWPVADIVLQHRECYDGSGFPQKIQGEAILSEARVLAVADALEDLTAHKSYRSAFPLSKALEEVSSHSGSRYDPEVVAACFRLFNEKGYRMEAADACRE
ncbi:MAG: HD domain-containing protein [Syntrophales bacterium]|nr:HD domain-containing protein [Syntrophales bacterium]